MHSARFEIDQSQSSTHPSLRRQTNGFVSLPTAQADPGFCGEVVGGRFFMNLAATLEATYECEVPEGVTIVGAAGYTIYWKPTEARTDRELRQLVNGDLSGFGRPRAVLDGERIDLDRAFAKTGVYSVRLGEESLTGRTRISRIGEGRMSRLRRGSSSSSDSTSGSIGSC